MRFAIPAGAIAAIATNTANAIARGVSVDNREARTIAFMVLLVVALYVLVILARPFTKYRAALVAAMIGGASAVVLIPALRHTFHLQIPDDDLLMIGLGCAVAGCVFIELATRSIRETTRRAEEPEDPDDTATAPTTPAPSV
jgi:cation-transporting ATPase E